MLKNSIVFHCIIFAWPYGQIRAFMSQIFLINREVNPLYPSKSTHLSFSLILHDVSYSYMKKIFTRGNYQCEQ
jgi:hypothetical protein